MNSQTEIQKVIPVIVAEIKTTSDPEILQLRLEQAIDKPIDNANSLLGFTMEGHSAFTSSSKPRTMYQNFSKAKVTALGLTVGAALPANLGAKLVVHEFCEGDIIPEEVKAISADYKGKATFAPRVWIDKATGLPKKQSPKTAGKDGEVLTRGESPIYRNVYLTVKGMVQEDLLVAHTNTIVGSNQTANASTANVVGEAAIAGN